MAKKQNKTQRIKALLSSRPELTAKEVAEKLGVSANLVHQVKWQSKKQVKRPSKIIKAVQEMKTTLDALDKIKDRPKKSMAIQEGNDLANKIFQETYDKYHADLVNHPPHYKTGGVETIDFIEAKDLNYRLGNVVKYITRAEKKGNPIEDLKKARWYLDREISVRENA
jgi:predicted ArsR family transcriptional regulator